MENIHQYIKTLVSKKPGVLVYPSDFRGIGTDMAIKQALSRMVGRGELKRLAHGMYYFPKIVPQLGALKPGVDDVLKMLKEKEKIKIAPTGSEALHILGLTTQVPTRRVYLTDGSQRVISIGRMKIKLKATTPKKMSKKGKISALLINALEELGTENINAATEQKIKALLKQEQPHILAYDLRLSTVKVNNYIVSLLKEDQR